MKHIVLGLMLIFSSTAIAKEIADIKIPETLNCEGKDLPLQGAGLRKATVFGIKVFVMAFYSAEGIKTADDTNLALRPMCFDITYLREFDNDDVDKAWEFQFKESSIYPYAELKDHVAEIKTFFGEIKGDRKQSFVLLADTTKIYENGKLKGEIKGAPFQKNFLSVWFGKNPPTKALQEGLMKK